MDSRTAEEENLNYSDDELTLKELKKRYLVLKSEIENKKTLKENLLILVNENKSIAESLLQAKQDYKNQESELSKTLFFIQVNADKQKILSRKKVNEFTVKHNKIKEIFKKLPLQSEFEELSNFNILLKNEIQTFMDLLENVKKEHDVLLEKLSNNFQEKVCEFCDTILRFKN